MKNIHLSDEEVEAIRAIFNKIEHVDKPENNKTVFITVSGKQFEVSRCQAAGLDGDECGGIPELVCELVTDFADLENVKYNLIAYISCPDCADESQEIKYESQEIKLDSPLDDLKLLIDDWNSST